MKLKRNIGNLVLAGAMALGCAGCNKAKVIESTPYHVVAEITGSGEDLLFTYNGHSCLYSERTPTNHSKDTEGIYKSNDIYDVETTKMFFDEECDNKIDKYREKIVLIPKKEGMEEQIYINEIPREIYESMGDFTMSDVVDPALRDFREAYGLDKIMQDWDKQYKK